MYYNAEDRDPFSQISDLYETIPSKIVKQGKGLRKPLENKTFFRSKTMRYFNKDYTLSGDLLDYAGQLLVEMYKS